MEKLNCPHCDGEVLNDERLAGRVVSCPTCNKPFRMPESADKEEDFAFEQPAAPSPPKSSAPPKPPPPSKKPRSSPQISTAISAHEPWYYRFLEKYARVLLVLGITQAIIALALVIFWTVITFVIANIIDAELIVRAVATFLVLVFAVILFLVAFFFAVALVHLAVDMGRNLRALREQIEMKNAGNK